MNNMSIITLRKDKDETVRDCRICVKTLSTNKQVYGLFEAWDHPWEGMEATIADDLNRLTNIEVTRTDILSKVICKLCYVNLHRACYFVKLVQKNDQMLKRSVQAEIDVPKKPAWPQPIQVEQNIDSIICDSRMEVEVKQEVISEEEDFAADDGDWYMPLDGVEVKAEPEEITPQNPISNRISMGTLRPNAGTLTNGDGYLQVEYLDSVKEERLSEDEAEVAAWDLPLDCQLCSKDFHSISGLKAHVIAHHSYKGVRRRAKGIASPSKRSRPNTHVCATCRRTFDTPTDLMIHGTCHGQVTCFLCKTLFDTFAQLTAHRVKCPLARDKGNEPTRLKTLEDVKRVQPAPSKTVPQKETTLSCPSCPEQFSEAYYLSIHQEIHHSTPNNEFNEADNSEFANQSELSDAINKVLERVSESLEMEEGQSGGEQTKQNKPVETVNRVLERMRKSLGVVDDSEAMAPTEQLASENTPSVVIKSDLQRVTGTLGLEDSSSEQLANKSDPSDIHEKLRRSLDIEIEKTGDLCNVDQNQSAVTVESVLERVSDAPASENESPDKVSEVLERVGDSSNGEQLVTNNALDSELERMDASSEVEKKKIGDSPSNESPDKVNEVLDAVENSLITEEETIADSNGDQPATNNELSDNVDSELVGMEESLEVEKEKIEHPKSPYVALENEPSADESMTVEKNNIKPSRANQINAQIYENMECENSDLDTDEINSGLGRENQVTDSAEKDDTDNGIEIVTKEATECRSNIESIFSSSASLYAQSVSDKSVDTNVVDVSEDVGDVNKLLCSANAQEDNFGSLDDIEQAVLSRDLAFQCSGEKLLGNQVCEMEIDIAEAASETLESALVASHIVREGSEHEVAEKVSEK